MRRKKLTALVLVSALALTTLGGCAKSEDAGTSKAPTTTTAAGAGTAAAETKKEADKGTEEKTVIRIWSKNRHDANYVQEKVDAYNSTNTDNIEVQYELFTDNYPQAVDIAMQNGDMPDLLMVQPAVFTKYLQSGQWADLNQFMDEDMKKMFADVMYEGSNQFDGKVYFIPTSGSTCRLFYNKEVFEKAGITKVPATLEELVETSKAITSKLSGEGIYGFASNLKSVSSALNRSFALGIARETGTWNGFDFKKGEYDFNCYADALKLWKELLSEGSAFPGCESLDIDPLRTQFAAGKIGMYCSYTAAEPGVYANQFPLDYSKWDCAPIPTTGGKEVGRQNFEGTNGYLLNAKSENIEAAFKAYKDIFTSEDYLKGYYEAAYGISIVPSIIEGSSPAGAYKDSKWLLLTDKDGILPLAPHDVNAVLVEGQDMYSTLGNILLGDAPIEATLKDLTDRYNAAYKKGIADGTGKEIKIENYDPMNPS